MSILSTSLSALRMSQRALETTSHNIANVNTPGFSRQRLDLGTRIPTELGFGSIGNGVEVTGVRRIFDQFINDQVTNNVSEFGRLEAFSGLADRLGNLFGDAQNGLAANMQAFFSAASDVANDPASISARETMLSETRVVIERLNQTAAQLNSIGSELNSRISQSVADIDALAGSIADLNDQIVSSGGSFGSGTPNDLLDQRDQLINELASQVSITTAHQDDGSLNVFFGNGQVLVVGSTSSDISTQTDPLDASRVTVQLGVAGSSANVTSAINGGELGGLLDFASEGLGTASNELGRIATAFALEVNATHRNGMDLDGKVGNDFFNISDPAVQPSQNNTSTADLTVSITDLSQFGADDFIIRFDGTDYSITSEQTGGAISFTGTGTSGDPLSFGGMELVVSGTPTAGDEFSLQPNANAASSISLAVNSGREIAAAYPIRADAENANTGTGTIAIERVFDSSNAGLQAPVSIEFLSDSTFQINGSGSFNYTPGEAISVNGYDLAISGTPQTGDTFTVESNAGGIGDNRNILSIGQLANDGLLDGGRETLNDAVGSLIAQAGISGREASRGLAAQSVLLEQSEARRLEVSGVNLDEEAANLLQFQQTYEAAAQMIAVSDSLFATLLNAVGR